jgi:phage shock protein E
MILFIGACVRVGYICKKHQRMKRQLISLLLVLSVVSGYAQLLSPCEFKYESKKQKGVILDVRSPEEFLKERIEGAINMDTGHKDFLDHLDSLDKTKTYFLYCYNGKRSARIAIYMKELGFTKVYDLEGGLKAWKTKKYRTVINS